MNRKIVKIGAGILICMMSVNISAMAAEQSDRWTGSGERWQVSDNTGGYIKDCWFQDDVTGHWYLLGAEDGSVMYAGLVTDNSTGKTYLLNVNHDGTYGRMVTTDGVYNLNGKDVKLNFNQEHDGAFGAIIGGLDEARSSGIPESKRDSIPVAGDTQQQQQSQDTNNPVHGQIKTNKNGNKFQWDATLNKWVPLNASMTHLDEKSAVWDNDMAELAKQVGANMRQ